MNDTNTDDGLTETKMQKAVVYIQYNVSNDRNVQYIGQLQAEFSAVDTTRMYVICNLSYVR